MPYRVFHRPPNWDPMLAPDEFVSEHEDVASAERRATEELRKRGRNADVSARDLRPGEKEEVVVPAADGSSVVVVRTLEGGL